MSAPGLRARQLACRYPPSSVDVVDIDELSLGSGVTGLVGVNGAGKTTLLLALAGARRPQGGTVTLDGVDVYGRHRRELVGRIGLMPQELDLPRELRVADALSYVSWLRGVPRRVAGSREPELLALVGLQQRRRERVGRLSGGMRRRLVLATALVTAPQVLLLDEPTTGLDPEQRAQLRRLLMDLPGATVTVLSSHVMEDVERMSTRIVVLDAGRVVHHGDTARFVEERGGPDRSAELAFLSTLARERA
ncbi:ABC transporter ATP-binding protein [Nocardioides sp. cx-173]|uniref:ABC transporter ATP-binding protein n=1 Tax=Nocardioides sp. cx-173 TaxID=2898796 RepID=UPI001E3000F1|nr:ATP-binding cassette domain-containing protein [Nocardioides sp. cx-173]MCD4523352.1 ATP-binding cassette domain-containing protein [Nocardioides sp. cx-173]UGB42308.1 ATP-binding cassette domain-containing protein [Nocardioides sp. cx-173]